MKEILLQDVPESYQICAFDTMRRECYICFRCNDAWKRRDDGEHFHEGWLKLLFPWQNVWFLEMYWIYVRSFYNTAPGWKMLRMWMITTKLFHQEDLWILAWRCKICYVGRIFKENGWFSERLNNANFNARNQCQISPRLDWKRDVQPKSAT